MVDGRRGHGGARRRARRDLHHRGAPLDARGARTDPAQRREAIRAVNLRPPHPVETPPVRFENHGDRVLGTHHPVAYLQSESHGRSCARGTWHLQATPRQRAPAHSTCALTTSLFACTPKGCAAPSPICLWFSSVRRPLPRRTIM